MDLVDKPQTQTLKIPQNFKPYRFVIPVPATPGPKGQWTLFVWLTKMQTAAWTPCSL